jgi:RecB family exonuclease
MSRLGLPDPPGASLVRGRVVHRLAEAYFRAVKAGSRPEAEDLAQTFDCAWDDAAANAVFQADDDVDSLKRQTAQLSRKYLEEIAPEIQPAEVELPVTGMIGGVAVQGIIDLIDTDGRIIDLKTASRKPSGISPDYALQVATYCRLAPGASGQVRLDTVVATKTPQIVTLPYEVSAADLRMAEVLYPHVREGIREGLFFPNRCSNLCSRRTCAFAEACEQEFGGIVR